MESNAEILKGFNLNSDFPDRDRQNDQWNRSGNRSGSSDLSPDQEQNYTEREI